MTAWSDEHDENVPNTANLPRPSGSPKPPLLAPPDRPLLRRGRSQSRSQERSGSSRRGASTTTGCRCSRARSLAGLVEPLVAKVNPAELESREIAPGSVVRLTSEARTAQVGRFRARGGRGRGRARRSGRGERERAAPTAATTAGAARLTSSGEHRRRPADGAGMSAPTAMLVRPGGRPAADLGRALGRARW